MLAVTWGYFSVSSSGVFSRTVAVTLVQSWCETSEAAKLRSPSPISRIASVDEKGIVGSWCCFCWCFGFDFGFGLVTLEVEDRGFFLLGWADLGLTASGKPLRFLDMVDIGMVVATGLFRGRGGRLKGLMLMTDVVVARNLDNCPTFSALAAGLSVPGSTVLEVSCAKCISWMSA